MKTRTDRQPARVAVVAATAVLLVGAALYAGQAAAEPASTSEQVGYTVGSTMRQIGHGARDIGRGIGEGAAKFGRNVGGVAREVGVAVGNAGRSVGHAARDGSKALVRGLKGEGEAGGPAHN